MEADDVVKLIPTAITLSKSISSSVKEIRSRADTSTKEQLSEIMDGLFESQSSLSSFQKSLSELISEIKNLKTTVALINEWDETLKNYDLFKFNNGQLAYKYNNSDKPEHCMSAMFSCKK